MVNIVVVDVVNVVVVFCYDLVMWETLLSELVEKMNFKEMFKSVSCTAVFIKWA